MKIIFYITNHGYGHASRNAAIIQELTQKEKESHIIIKSDEDRCRFLQRNLGREKDQIQYYIDCKDTGLVLEPGTLNIDVSATKTLIQSDVFGWKRNIERETRFIQRERPDLIVTDILCWPILCAKECGVKAIVIGNFTWSSMYKYLFNDETFKPFYECYKQADMSIWYEIHDPELELYTKRKKCVSLVSRRVDHERAKTIAGGHKQPIVFVTLGASADIAKEIDVSSIPYDFVITRGIPLYGGNVYLLPNNTINTQDYIAASEYVIAKGGWSTVSEILLQKKKCCLLSRGTNREDDITRKYLKQKGHCIMINENELFDICGLIEKMKTLQASPYDYYDSTKQICSILVSEANEKGGV